MTPITAICLGRIQFRFPFQRGMEMIHSSLIESGSTPIKSKSYCTGMRIKKKIIFLIHSPSSLEALALKAIFCSSIEQKNVADTYRRIWFENNVFSGVKNDKGELRDELDAVASSHDQEGDGGGSKGRDYDEATLLDVDAMVPTVPDLCGSEHPAIADHVTEHSLAGTVGTTIQDVGDTGDGATDAPRLRRGLVIGELGNGIGLVVVLREVGMDEIDDVGVQYKEIRLLSVMCALKDSRKPDEDATAMFLMKALSY